MKFLISRCSCIHREVLFYVCMHAFMCVYVVIKCSRIIFNLISRNYRCRNCRNVPFHLKCHFLFFPFILWVQKKLAPFFDNLLLWTDFSSLVFAFLNKLQMKLDYNLPPHLKSIATLPCKVNCVVERPNFATDSSAVHFRIQEWMN